MKHLVVVLAAAAGLAGCHSVTAAHNLCGGTEACPHDACAPLDILDGRPARPFQPLGVVQVRVDRGTMFKNPTLNDALPALESEARSMGADAVILTHEEFTSWYDKGEDVSPIHDLEKQESWYITEKARYLSGLAVVYTGGPMPMAAPPQAPTASYGAPPPAPGTQVGPNGERVVYSVIIPNGPGQPAAAPAPAGPPPPPPPAPESAPRYPPTPISAEVATPVAPRTLPPPRHVK